MEQMSFAHTLISSSHRIPQNWRLCSISLPLGFILHSTGRG